MTLILYSKPGCHLCEGLQEKLEKIQASSQKLGEFQLEIRDITSREDWFQTYQYEIPVLFKSTDSDNIEQRIPRPSPRMSVIQLEQLLQKYW
ncbi:MULTISPECIES: glutaredoxin family protein [Planktothrix]|uniref:glutaredoxin family protein n=1 Tax=Planktothrix TaxID=54304 RepID=UPI0028150BB5|nr:MULTISPECIES: glutaredoxin family protein [Planktothrix]